MKYLDFNPEVASHQRAFAEKRLYRIVSAKDNNQVVTRLRLVTDSKDAKFAVETPWNFVVKDKDDDTADQT